MGLLKTGWKYIAQEKEPLPGPLVDTGQTEAELKPAKSEELGRKVGLPAQSKLRATHLWWCWSEALGAHHQPSGCFFP